MRSGVSSTVSSFVSDHFEKRSGKPHRAAELDAAGQRLRFAIRNPLVVSGIAVALCLFGLFAFFSLGVAIAPNVNIPQAVVTTTYPGADPATIEANVTRPIEDAIATLPNIDTNGLTSTSASGVSIVSVQFTSAANPRRISSSGT